MNHFFQKLLKFGHILVLKSETANNNFIDLRVKNQMSFELSSSFKSNHLEQATTLAEDLQELTTAEVEAFRGDLSSALEHPEDSFRVADYFMSLSPIASASSAGKDPCIKSSSLSFLIDCSSNTP